MRENLKKISIVIKNVIGSEDTLTHKAERPSNYFFSNTATVRNILMILGRIIEQVRAECRVQE